MNNRATAIVGVWFAWALATTLHAQPQAPEGLLCDLLRRPDLAVITNPRPAFGWIVSDPSRGAVQSAYQIVVASGEAAAAAGKGDLWDSGKVVSNQSIDLRYAGKDLAPNAIYWWAVRTWDAQDRPSPLSKPQRFNTGEFNAKRSWPGESRWVKIKNPDGSETMGPENRHPSLFRTLPAQKVVKTGEGNYYIEFPKDAFATLQLKITSPDSRKIEIHLGEKTTGAGVDRKPGGSLCYLKTSLAVQPGTRTYTLELPRHVSRYPHSQRLPANLLEVEPFRYAEVANCPGELKAADVSQYALFYLFDDEAAAFESSNADLNAVWDLCWYTLKTTPFMGLYTDGIRERMPYEADAYIQQLGHYCLDREYAIQRHSADFLNFHATWPTEWILMSVAMAWDDYRHTGSTDFIAGRYDLLKAKTLLALADKDNLISTRTGKMTKDVLRSIHFNAQALRDIVDWPNRNGSYPPAEVDSYVFTNYNTAVNAWHYHALVQMADIAQALHKADDAAFFQQRAEQVRQAFNKTFLDPQRGIYVDGETTKHASQHANAFPLAFGLAPEKCLPAIVAHIQSRGMACGPYGSQYLLEGLYNASAAQAALDLMTARTDRSWLNMLKVGATMTCESWDQKYKQNWTWNHAWSAGPANIIPRKLMGIEPLEPGFAKIRVRPQIANLAWAQIKMPTIRGTVLLRVERKAGGCTLNVTIPANASAQVHVPAKDPAAVTEGGKPAAQAPGVKFLRSENGAVVFEVGSGRYAFVSPAEK